MFHVNCHLWTRISPSHPEVNSSLLTVMFYRSPSKSNLQRSVTYTNPPPRISLKSNVTWTNPSSSSTWPSSLKLSSYRNIIINLLCTTYLVTPASTRLEATMTREAPRRNRDVCMSPWCLVTSHQCQCLVGSTFIHTDRHTDLITILLIYNQWRHQHSSPRNHHECWHLWMIYLSCFFYSHTMYVTI